MSAASSTSEQTLFTRDVNGSHNSEENIEQTQHVVADGNIQNHMHTSQEAYILDKDKTLAPPSPNPSAENITNENNDKVAPLCTASSDPTPNIGCTEPALPQAKESEKKYIVNMFDLDLRDREIDTWAERLTMSRDLSPPPLGGSQSSQIEPLDVTLMHLDGASSGDPQTALPTSPNCSPCSALDPASNAPNNIPNVAELFGTRHVTYADHRSPSRPTTTVSSPDASDKTDPPSVDSDAHFTPREGLPYRPQSYETGTLSLSPTPGALTPFPVLTVETLVKDSSPLHPEPGSDVCMHSTPPLSSPQMESDLIIMGDLPARHRDTGCNGVDAKIDDYPAITMSSPNFPLPGDEFSVKSSPPYPTTGTKRARYDDSDEESTSAKPMKRVRTDDTMSSPLRDPPAPRRATLASQRLSRKRLAAPFRSPLQTKMMSTQPTTPAPLGKDTQEQIASAPRAKYQINPKSAQEAPAGTSRAIKSLVRSSRAATQFRSPLMTVPDQTPRPLVLPNQTTMNLERKLTLLRRAVKIKRDGDDAHLERLAKKWRDAGREAAYELWGIVRDLSTDEGEIRGNGNDNGWNWGEQGTSREADADTEVGKHVEKQENTLGVMLRKLGIAPETLGWNEEEEAFVDDE